VKPAPFIYHRPGTREEVDALLAEFGEGAKLLAGGQSLVPLLSMRLLSPEHLIDLNGLRDEPKDPQTSGELVSISPLVRHAAVERSPHIAERVPLLRDAMRLVAHPAIRSRGTFLGAVAHADPASEIPALVLALDATAVARGVRGTRELPISEFFVGPLETALEPDEWLCEVRLPAQAGAGAIEEFSRRDGDYALCGVVVAATAGSARSDAVLAYFGVGDMPERLTLEDVTDAGAARLAELIDARLEATDDIHASAAYRRHLAHTLGARALRRVLAAESAGGSR
jgi:aerobic carbon-monoxide dehydrogenase medium subunit